jgi:hypothetical protein
MKRSMMENVVSFSHPKDYLWYRSAADGEGTGISKLGPIDESGRTISSESPKQSKHKNTRTYSLLFAVSSKELKETGRIHLLIYLLPPHCNDPMIHPTNNIQVAGCKGV